jgi:hypothetical protein
MPDIDSSRCEWWGSAQSAAPGKGRVSIGEQRILVASCCANRPSERRRRSARRRETSLRQSGHRPAVAPARAILLDHFGRRQPAGALSIFLRRLTLPLHCATRRTRPNEQTVRRVSRTGADQGQPEQTWRRRAPFALEERRACRKGTSSAMGRGAAWRRQ